MIKVVGVRFRTAGKIYYFDPKDLELPLGSHVIVETARGVEYGTVMVPPKGVTDDEVVQPLKPVLRASTPEDDKTEQKNREKERQAYKTCQEKIQKHKLNMKLVEAEYTFDNNKLLFSATCIYTPFIVLYFSNSQILFYKQKQKLQCHILIHVKMQPPSGL